MLKHNAQILPIRTPSSDIPTTNLEPAFGSFSRECVFTLVHFPVPCYTQTNWHGTWKWFRVLGVCSGSMFVLGGVNFWAATFDFWISNILAAWGKLEQLEKNLWKKKLNVDDEFQPPSLLCRGTSPKSSWDLKNPSAFIPAWTSQLLSQAVSLVFCA